MNYPDGWEGSTLYAVVWSDVNRPDEAALSDKLVRDGDREAAATLVRVFGWQLESVRTWIR